MQSRMRWAAVGGVVAALASTAAAGGATSPPSRWVTSSVQHHSATITLVAGLTNDDAGFNFDGYSKGKLVLTVPAGWTVHVVFRNAVALPHSVMVVAWSTKPTATHPKPAIKGAASPNPYAGSPKGGKARFSFKAKAGKYRVICAVPGHDAAGMWDTLIVKRGAKKASATAA